MSQIDGTALGNFLARGTVHACDRHTQRHHEVKHQLIVCDGAQGVAAVEAMSRPGKLRAVVFCYRCGLVTNLGVAF